MDKLRKGAKAAEITPIQKQISALIGEFWVKLNQNSYIFNAQQMDRTDRFVQNVINTTNIGVFLQHHSGM